MKNKEELTKIADENTNIDTIKSIYEYIVKTNKVSTNLIQREFNLGFNSVSKIIQLFELYGIVSSYNQETRRITGTTKELEQLIKDIKNI